jgi:muramidase (phage lysozyme)
MATISATAAGSPNIPKFLDLVGSSEGTTTDRLTQNDGYDVIVSGVDGPEVFTDFSDHPFANGRAPKIIRPANATVPQLVSTASGRYQVLCRYFEVYKQELKLPDFSPLSQDLVAIQQIKERRDANQVSAYTHIVNGDIETAISLCCGIWASLPGNTYGQGGHSMTALMTVWSSLPDPDAAASTTVSA